MNNINLIFTETDFYSVIVFLATLTYLLSCVSLLILIKKKKYIKINRFIKTISIALKEDNIKTISDINNIYMGIFGLHCDTKDSTYCGNISKLLRKILVEIINNLGMIKELNIQLEQRKLMKEKISEYINFFEKTYPYANLPLAEMNIMNDISVYIENKDIDSITRKVNELTGIIQVRAEENKKLETATKWSIPLAVIGLILTVIFGISSYIK